MTQSNPQPAPDASRQADSDSVSRCSDQACLCVERALRHCYGRWTREIWTDDRAPQRLRAWLDQHKDCDCFQSMCRFVAPDRRSTHVADLVIDIDCEGDLAQAQREAVLAKNLIAERLGIPPTAIEIAFSGYKGFHLWICRECFGSPEPGDDLRVWAALARKLEGAGVTHVDTAIYDSARLIRVFGSKHYKSELFKIPLDAWELESLSIDEIRDRARQPHDCSGSMVTDLVPKAALWYRRTAEILRTRHAQWRQQPQAIRGQGWTTPPCIRKIESGMPLRDGHRHQIYFALSRWFHQAGASNLEIARRISAIDAHNPIHDPDYITRVATARNRYPLTRCPARDALAPFCDPSQCPLSPAPGSAPGPGTPAPGSAPGSALGNGPQTCGDARSENRRHDGTPTSAPATTGTHDRNPSQPPGIDPVQSTAIPPD